MTADGSSSEAADAGAAAPQDVTQRYPTEHDMAYGNSSTPGSAPTDAGSLESAAVHPGAPDGFQRLWTPHRLVYIQGENKPPTPHADECPFCAVRGRSDEEGLIVHRGDLVYAVLNLYPYSPGHVLVCPYRHVADYTDLSLEETAELAAVTQQAMRVIRTVSGPQGFNLGMNQGAVAGAGIAAHLHEHVVPRWAGDANFLPVIGQTKALPQLLGQTRELLDRAWNGG